MTETTTASQAQAKLPKLLKRGEFESLQGRAEQYSREMWLSYRDDQTKQARILHSTEDYCAGALNEHNRLLQIIFAYIESDLGISAASLLKKLR